MPCGSCAAGCRHLDLHFYGLSAAPRAGEGEGGAEAAAPALSALARIVACCFDAERLTIVDLSLNPLEPLGVAQVALLLLGNLTVQQHKITSLS
jgi:hypothetical protein